MDTLPAWIRYSVTKITGDEGFTIHPETGFYTGAGYGVGMYPERERRVIRTVSDLDLALELQLFSRLNSDLLKKPNHYIGAWHQHDQVILDIAVITPTSGEARRLGAMKHQDFYYDFVDDDARLVAEQDDMAHA